MAVSQSANVDRLTPIVKLLKPLLVRTVARQGAVRMILFGPARGLRYRILGPFRAPILGGWEPEAQRLMVQHVHRGGVAYDVGANIGIHTLLMARLAGPTGRVYAFEPVPHLFECLRTNLQLNAELSGAVPMQLAMSDRIGVATFDTRASYRRRTPARRRQPGRPSAAGAHEHHLPVRGRGAA